MHAFDGRAVARPREGEGAVRPVQVDGQGVAGFLLHVQGSNRGVGPVVRFPLAAEERGHVGVVAGRVVGTAHPLLPRMQLHVHRQCLTGPTESRAS